jgi:putative addiction module killer protein
VRQLTVDTGSTVAYRIHVFEVQKTDEFAAWLLALENQKAVAKIASRIERLGLGNPGDVKPVGEVLARCV